MKRLEGGCFAEGLPRTRRAPAEIRRSNRNGQDRPGWKSAMRAGRGCSSASDRGQRLRGRGTVNCGRVGYRKQASRYLGAAQKIGGRESGNGQERAKPEAAEAGGTGDGEAGRKETQTPRGESSGCAGSYWRPSDRMEGRPGFDISGEATVLSSLYQLCFSPFSSSLRYIFRSGRQKKKKKRGYSRQQFVRGRGMAVKMPFVVSFVVTVSRRRRDCVRSSTRHGNKS